MPLYSRPTTPEEQEEEFNNPEPVSPKTEIKDAEKTWEKRYSDLRSHTQKQLNAMEKQVKDLTAQLSRPPENNLPKTKAEVEAWAAKYPDVYGLVKSIAGIDIQEATSTIEERFRRLDERELELQQESSKQQLAKLHPDFFEEIAPSQEFVDWLATRSIASQKIMYEGDDVEAASEVIDAYKATLAKPTTPKKKDTSAAGDVNPRRTSPSPSSNHGDYDFTELEIEQMSDHDFEKLETKIDEARRQGRILYNGATGAAS